MGQNRQSEAKQIVEQPGVLDDDRLLYLYGVVARGQAIPATGRTGLEAVPVSSLVAIVEPVPWREFSSEVLEQQLQRFDWVAPLACKHTAMLEEIMRYGPVVPARLCTLFNGPGALASSLAENEQRLHDALRVLEGRQEWGLKIFSSEERLHTIAAASDLRVRALEAAAATASPGEAYVLRKQRDAHLAEVVAARIEESLDEVREALTGVAAETWFRTPLTEAATGRADAMSLNAALLVDLGRARALHATIGALIARLGMEGFTLELTGPWPPYSFCDDEPVFVAEELTAP